MSDEQQLWAVIMAGGSGTRFWPVSRKQNPKQLSSLLGETTMIQATVARLQPAIPPERTLVITTAAIADATRAQLPILPAANIIAEPMGRDTAPCVALAAEIVAAKDPAAVMVLLPADQVIAPASEFQRCLQAGAAVARRGGLVTYGIRPRFPATGYGYIALGAESEPVDGISVHRVDRFVEKPDQLTAEAYLAAGSYRWNSGIFTWTVATVRRELAAHCPQLSAALQPVGAAFGSDGFETILQEVYPSLEKISVDYALMERAKDISVISTTFDWDDVGSWDALYDHLEADASGLRSQGQVLARDCRESLLLNTSGATLTAIGCEEMTVIATPDAILVMPRGRSQEVKQLYESLQKEHPELT